MKIQSRSDELNDLEKVEETWISANAKQLSKLLFGKSEEFYVDLKKIINNNLEKNFSRVHTWYQIRDVLVFYLDADQEIIQFLMTLIAYGLEDNNLIDNVKPHLNEQVWYHLKNLICLYNHDFMDIDPDQENDPQSWQAANHKICYDYTNESWQVVISIDKLNQESSVYIETPKTLLDLTKFFLTALQEAQQAYQIFDISDEIFTDEDIRDFQDECDYFFSLFEQDDGREEEEEDN